ncbi:MAG: hypothetical protein ACLP9Y_30010 [Mycobacterium sp.]
MEQATGKIYEEGVPNYSSRTLSVFWGVTGNLSGQQGAGIQQVSPCRVVDVSLNKQVVRLARTANGPVRTQLSGQLKKAIIVNISNLRHVV